MSKKTKGERRAERRRKRRYAPVRHLPGDTRPKKFVVQKLEVGNK